jgi:hypothetical protein
MERRNFIKITLPLLTSHQLLAKNAESEKPEVSFGVIADPQYADVGTTGTRFYRNSLAKLTSAITELNKHSLEFTVTLGDVIDRDFKSFDEILPIYKTAKAQQTFVLGNHDFEVADEDKSKVLPKLGLEKAYYSRSLGDWHFIYLDGNDVSTYRYPKESEETKAAKKRLESLNKPQAKPWNGCIGDEQITWLSAQLDAANKTNKRFIIFNHFPVFPLNNSHNLWNDDILVELIASYKNVVAYMNGHNHQGNYAVHSACHFINFKGMVETEKATPFAIVKCFADRIEIDGFDTEPNRELAY